MMKSLLIVSADTKFAQVLLHGLEQEGFRVQIAKGKGETVVRADEENSSLAFLDMDLGYRAVLEIGQALRMLNPDIRLVVFAREEVPPQLDELQPWTLSPKPYFLPDVLNMLNDNSTPASQFSNTPHRRDVQTNDSALPWLQDVSRAAQHLTRLTLESSAQAALITRGDNLWAYAGQLSERRKRTGNRGHPPLGWTKRE
jgi:DNA-binding NtrC family response regulator